jgi:hypothetical protein
MDLIWAPGTTRASEAGGCIASSSVILSIRQNYRASPISVYRNPIRRQIELLHYGIVNMTIILRVQIYANISLYRRHFLTESSFLTRTTAQTHAELEFYHLNIISCRLASKTLYL